MCGKKTILLIVIAVTLAIIFGLLFTHYTNSNVNSSSDETSMGTLEIKEEVIQDDYEAGSSDGLEEESIYVAVNHSEYLTNILTLQALSEISDQAAQYLALHGYANSHSITVIENSIIAEKSYPYFECEIDETDKILCVRYHLETMEYEFEIE